MKADYEVYYALEDIYFKYERIRALVEILQMVIDECADVVRMSDNAASYALYEIEFRMAETNKEFFEAIGREKCIE